MMLDDIPEYREMRKGLMALRLEVDANIADDLLLRCERACAAAYEEGRRLSMEGEEDNRQTPAMKVATQMLGAICITNISDFDSDSDSDQYEMF